MKFPALKLPFTSRPPALTSWWVDFAVSTGMTMHYIDRLLIRHPWLELRVREGVISLGPADWKEQPQRIGTRGAELTDDDWKRALAFLEDMAE